MKFPNKTPSKTPAFINSSLGSRCVKVTTSSSSSSMRCIWPRGRSMWQGSSFSKLSMLQHFGNRERSGLQGQGCKLVINSNLFMTMLDLKPAKQSIQQFAAACSHLNTKHTQYAIIAAMRAELSRERGTPSASSTRLTVSDWKYSPPSPFSLSLSMKKIHSYPLVSAPRMMVLRDKL